MYKFLTIASAIVLLGALTACGGTANGTGNEDDASKPQVAAAFYPLKYATQEIAGNHANVTDLTKPGAEPHEMDLTAQEIVKVQEADLVVYLANFQPAVDEAVSQRVDKPSLEVGQYADLQTRDEEAEGAEHHEEEGEHAHGATDPHFWLDPVRYAQVVPHISEQLQKLDSSSSKDFELKAKGFETKLTALNTEFEKGLANCGNKNLVTSHEAFGYLAERYGLKQVGITGLVPEGEPTLQDLEKLTKFVKDNSVTTIYSETLVSPAIADTIARETGAKVAVLDPIEGLTKESAGDNYFEVMRSNLATLKKGQGCT